MGKNVSADWGQLVAVAFCFCALVVHIPPLVTFPSKESAMNVVLKFFLELII
jgi:hypothetical protein